MKRRKRLRRFLRWITSGYDTGMALKDGIY